MSDQTYDVAILVCGPGSKKCRCDCGRDNKICEHDWKGEMIKTPTGGSVTCARCGMWAENHDAWL